MIAQRNNEWSTEESSSDSGEWYSGDEHDDRAYQKGGYLKCVPGDVLNNRYSIQKRIGWGHFAMVYLAIDKKAAKNSPNRYVALKIQKSHIDYQEAAEEEIPFLEKVAEKEKELGIRSNVTRMLDNFETYGPHGKHYVMVFEVYGINPGELLEDFEAGLPIAMVKAIMRDLLQGLDFLHMRAGIMHLDIKPENCVFELGEPIDEEEIALSKKHYEVKQSEKALKDAKKKLERNHKKLSKNQRKRLKDKIKKLQNKLETQPDLEELPSDFSKREKFVRHYLSSFEGSAGKPDNLPRAILVDLGTACWSDKVNTHIVGTRYGRAPEMLVGLRYDPPADIWTMACLCIELLAGDPFFDPASEDSDGNELDVDAEHLRIIAEAVGPKFPRFLCGQDRTREYLTQKGELKTGNVDFVGLGVLLKEQCELPANQIGPLLDFLKPMLEMNPEKRATARECLNNPWLEITDQDLQDTAEWVEDELNENEASGSDDADEASEADAEVDHDAELEDEDPVPEFQSDEEKKD